MAEADDTEEGASSAPAPADTPTDASASAKAPAAAPSGPDFTSLVKVPGDTAGLQAKLADIQRAKSAANAGAADETIKRLDTDRARMEAAYKASATMPAELQGWDAKAKSQEHSTDPVTAFGSVGSIFAMLASSFAGLPMEAGLNAGAAAINAVHAGDEKAYQREYESWKANTDLALKRHEIQHQAYTDATNLMNSNINAGRTKMELAATRFGDQKAQALLDAGMDKELFELVDSRNKAAVSMQDQWDKVQLQHEKVMDLKNDPRYSSGDMGQKAAAIQDWNQRWAANGGQKLRYDAEADYIAAQKRANPNWTPDDMLGWKKDFATASEGDGTSGKSKTAAGLQGQEIDRRTAVYEAQGMTRSEAYDRATREVKLVNSVPSGNRVDDLRGKIDQAKNIIAGSEKNLDFLDNYKGGAGLTGKLMRGEEIAENITGISDKSDRAQFRRRVLELQEMAPRILTDSNGRPLKSAQEKIDGIVAGLNAGDTGPNTKRAYRELIEDMRHRIEDYEKRLNAGGAPPAAGGSPGATGAGSSGGASSASKPKWQTAPIVGPRSEVESESAYG